MRALLLAPLLLASAAVTVPQTASAARHYPKTMTVQLANGKTIRFHVVRYHGQMMAMAPAIDFSDVFHR